MRGEREAGHKGTREVGNVDPDTEITLQFGANEQDAEGEKSWLDIHGAQRMNPNTLVIH